MQPSSAKRPPRQPLTIRWRVEPDPERAAAALARLLASRPHAAAGPEPAEREVRRDADSTAA